MAYGTLNAGAITPGSGNTLTVSEAVTFSGAVTMQSANNQGFASGTKMLFNQTAAPTGWTKVTSSNDVALRLTSGTVGTGGSVAFTTALGATIAVSVAVAGHSISEAELPSHTHSISSVSNWAKDIAPANADAPAPNRNAFTGSYPPTSGNTGSIGSGTAHTHGNTPAGVGSTASTHNLAVSYVDVIIATKD
jgi:hypothetical protein